MLKIGSLVRIDMPNTLIHGSIGIIVGIDENKNQFPPNTAYYKVLTSDGTTVPFCYQHLIDSTDGYFENDAYFLVPDRIVSITLKT